MKRTTLFATLIALSLGVGQAAQVFTPGILKYDYFPGQTRQTVEAGTAGSPVINPAGTIGSDTSGNIGIFQSGVGFADNYANRFSGFFVPPTTGDYVFFIAGDDDSDLFLSTDDTPANKRLIAQEASWSNDRNWITAGFGDATLKRSDQWSPDAGATVPFAAGIHLVAGTHYYLEGVHHEGTGGDDFGATYKLVSDSDPVDGDASLLTGAVIGEFLDSDVLLKVLTSQPPSRRVLVDDTPTLSVKAVAPDTRFQWYKGGTAISGATNSAYQLPAITAGDNGAVFYVTATNTLAGVQSSNAVITVGKLVLVAGAKDEVFDAATRDDVENGSLDGTTPFYLNNMLTFETPTNQTKDGADFPFTQRLSAIFLPPVTGDYVFFFAADDDSDLFISTDATPAKKYQIAAEPGWSAVRSYSVVGGGAPVSQKRSDMWVPDPNSPPPTPPFANGIHLIAGNKYYIEAVDHEGGGGDNLTATYKLVGEPDPANGSATRLFGFVLDKYVNSLDGGLITITTQPQNTTVDQSQTATLTIGATASYIGDTSSASPPLGYQWQAAPAGSSTFTNIAGELGTSYRTPILKLSDNGTKYRVALLAGDATANSSVATLTVTPDTTLPSLVSAFRNFADNTKTTVFFSEVVQGTSANLAANFTINNGIAVSAAALQADGKSVVLTTSPINKGTSNTLTVNGVLDLAGNQIAANSSVALGFSKGIYFVTADPGPLTFAGDIAVNQHLLDRGFDVELAQGALVPDDGASAIGRDLIIESSSLGSGTVEDPVTFVGKFKNLAIPAIEWEASSIDAFGFAEANAAIGTIAGATQINIVDASHPLAAGFPAGLVTVSAPETYSQSIPVGGHIVATPATDPTYAMIYYYEKGEKGFNDFVMPARRVFFFFQDNTAAVANDNGWKLFDAAVDWSLGMTNVVQPPPPAGLTLTSIASTANAVSLSWSGGAAPYLVQMKASLSDTNWFNVLTTSAQSATVARVGGAAFFRVADHATTVVIPLTAQLSGAGEVPAVTTPGIGLGAFSLEGDTLTYRISFNGLSGNATASHIHGPAEVTGTAPVIIPFTVSATPSGIISGSVAVTPDQKTNLLSGKTYANIHTGAHPGGEIRGQVNLAQFTAKLSGSGEVPAVTTSATGDGAFALIGNQLFYNISFTGLSGNATASHIHGPADISGAAPVIIPFTVSASTSGTISGTVTVTADQLANLVSGKTYANIHTAAHGGGEIRGQLVTLLLKATLSGSAEVPAVSATGSATGVFALTGNQLNYAITYSGLSGDPTASHIHGPADASATAGVIIPFTVSPGTSGTIAGTVAVTSDQLTYLLSGRTYANIHTAANPGGEIRGQIAP